MHVSMINQKILFLSTLYKCSLFLCPSMKREEASNKGSSHFLCVLFGPIKV